jgi:small conductance mechanosensitive channel
LVDVATIILIAQAVVVIAVSWLTAEFLTRIIARAAKKAGASPELTRTVREALSIVWIALAAAAIFSITGIASTFSFLTLSGLVGLAISLALQNTLSNIISGILLLSDGVLRLHDSVEYSGIRGRVVRIGLRTTWVKTDSGDIAIISNSYVANGPLINYTAGDRLERKLRV